MKQHIKNVVLVHGAFADGSGWKRVADILKNDGYKVSVAQPPETSYADDQKYTKAAIDAMGGPVVLVGHSYAGGSIITEGRQSSKCCSASLILPPLLSMKVRAVRRSNRLSAQASHGVQIGQQRALVDRTGAFRGRASQRIFRRMKAEFTGYSAGADLYRLVHPSG